VLNQFDGEAVLDKETGLVWETSPDIGTFTWSEAQQRCNTLDTGGRMGWRLPTLQELETLVDPSQSNPALPLGHPFSNVQSAYYWSSTGRFVNPDRVWDVCFSGCTSGTVSNGLRAGTGLNHLHVWCVRGGQGADPQ
jgi:hypothetical protein